VSSNNWIGSYDATLQDLVDSGSELGNHTAHHCNFNAACNGVGAGTADSEIDNCSSYIENTLGQDGVYTMAYPLGDTGYKTDAQERFFLARGTGGGMIAPNDSTDPFNLPTFGASGGEAASTFNGQIDTAKSQGKWVTFLFHSILPENWYAGVNLSTITESIDHAKGLGDVWIGTLRDVGAYWRAEKMLNDITPSDSSGTLTWSWTLPTHFPPGKFLRVTVDGGALSQGGSDLEWNGHGFYEVALDESPLVWTPP
jgi:peptidoglycan/xylan/chitin deacetylase (PgdA/CDA1 family)